MHPSVLTTEKGCCRSTEVCYSLSYLNFLLHLIIVFNHSTLEWFKIITVIWLEKTPTHCIMTIQNVNPKIILQYLCYSGCFSVSSAISTENRHLHSFHAEMCMGSFLLKKQIQTLKLQTCGLQINPPQHWDSEAKQQVKDASWMTLLIHKKNSNNLQQ